MEPLFWVILVTFWILASIVIMSIGERQRQRVTRENEEVINRCVSVPDKFVAVIAAYNEEELIESAVRSLYNSRLTDSISFMLVVVNNTTDRTLEILERLQGEIRDDWLKFINIPKEPDKKAGALNAGVEYLHDCLGDELEEYGIVALDADTIMISGTCKKAIEVFRKYPEAASLSVDYRLKPIKDILGGGAEPTIKQRILYAFQRIEYAMERTFKEAQRPYIKVLSGTCTVFKASVLLVLQETFGVVWPADSLVEDYSLTRNLQKLGFLTPGSTATSLTDVPMSIKALYKQRYRWYLGTLLVLRSTRCGVRDLFDFAKIFFQPVMLLLQLSVLVAAVYVATNPNVHILELLLPMLVVGLINFVIFFRNAEADSTMLEIVLVCIPFLLLMYAIFIECIYVKIIFDSFRVKDTREVGW